MSSLASCQAAATAGCFLPYGGTPEWYPARVVSSEKTIGDIPESIGSSIGMLCLSGAEELFAVDGQHRLSGIKEAIRQARESNKPEDWGHEFIKDEVSVLFIGYQKTVASFERTRRVFTTLNKTARAVNKGEIIALDENDPMAIVSRQLVEDHPYFRDGRVAIRATNNLSPSDASSFTTIGALYDVLTILFTKIGELRKIADLRFGNRPDAPALEEYYKRAVRYFEWLAMEIPELEEYFKSGHPRKIIHKYRGKFGGHFVFRPLGLLMITALVAKLYKPSRVHAAIKKVANLPLDLSSAPLAELIWNTSTKRIQPANRKLAIDVYLYLLGHLANTKEKEMLAEYKAVTGKEFRKL